MRGHVTKKGNKYYVVIFLGIDETTGKKKYKWYSGYDRQRDAEKDLVNKLKEFNDGLYVESDKITVAKYIEDWLNSKKTQIRPNTLRTYEWLINGHIIPNLGKHELKKLQPAHLQKLYTKLQTSDKPLSNRSVQQIHVLIHEALGRALQWGLVSRNIADAVESPRVAKGKGQSWTAEQTMMFLDASMENTYWIAFHLAVMTGMRKGEILALHWKDVDFDNGFIHVRGSLTFIKGEPLIQQPKTDRARRAIALSQDVIASLRKHRAKQNEAKILLGDGYKDKDLIVCRASGEPLNPRNLDDAWYGLLKKTGLPKIRFHDLRHTHASILLQQGVHPKVVSERLGHSNINITLDTYSHVLPGLQQQAADTFSEALKKKRG